MCQATGLLLTRIAAQGQRRALGSPGGQIASTGGQIASPFGQIACGVSSPLLADGAAGSPRPALSTAAAAGGQGGGAHGGVKATEVRERGKGAHGCVAGDLQRMFRSAALLAYARSLEPPGAFDHTHACVRACVRARALVHAARACVCACTRARACRACVWSNQPAVKPAATVSRRWFASGQIRVGRDGVLTGGHTAPPILRPPILRPPILRPPILRPPCH